MQRNAFNPRIIEYAKSSIPALKLMTLKVSYNLLLFPLKQQQKTNNNHNK